MTTDSTQPFAVEQFDPPNVAVEKPGVSVSSRPALLVRRVVFFLLGLLILHLALNWAYEHFVLSNLIQMRSQEQYDEYGAAATIIAMGDSHPSMAFSPTQLPGTFNFATPGENYLQTYYKLKAVCQDDRNQVSTVLLPIDLHSFSSFKVDRVGNAYYWKRYLDFAEIGRHRDERMKFLGKDLASHFSYFSGADDLLAYFLSSTRTEMVLGQVFGQGDFSQSKTPAEAAKARASGHLNQDNPLDPDALYYFQKSIAVCEENDVDVVLIKYPVTEIYASYAWGYMDSPETFYDTVLDVAHRAGQVEVLDYQELYFDRPELFNDPDHLNVTGAALVSARIGQDLQELSAAAESESTN